LVPITFSTIDNDKRRRGLILYASVPVSKSPMVPNQVAFAANSSPQLVDGKIIYHHYEEVGHVKACYFKLHRELKWKFVKNQAGVLRLGVLLYCCYVETTIGSLTSIIIPLYLIWASFKHKLVTYKIILALLFNILLESVLPLLPPLQSHWLQVLPLLFMLRPFNPLGF
jgi:hypothetical protein